MRAAILLLALLAGCTRREPPLLIDQPAQASSHDERGSPVETVRAAVRAEAKRLEQSECDDVRIPDSAFVPVEVTGGGDPEYAVFFAHASCDMSGTTSASAFTGTGGARIELWSARSGRPRLLLRHSMHGFTPTRDGFISLQHGGYCPDGAGPGMCAVLYAWKGPDQGFEVRSRRLYDDRHPGAPLAMRYDWNYPLPG